MAHIDILKIGKFKYEGVDDLEEKLSDLKKDMDDQEKVKNAIGITSTAYNIIHIMRRIEALKHKSQHMSDSSRMKIRMRTRILDALNKHEDPTETLKKLLKELG